MKTPWAVNDDDLENEFRYWMRELLGALKNGLVFAVLTCVAILLLPGGDDAVGVTFMRDFWPYLAELAFWLGMFVAMLWSAVKRAAAVLTGVLPWQAAELRASRSSRPK